MKQATLYRLMGAALVAGTLAASPASAAGYCLAGQATEGIAPGDLSFGGIAANDCYGVVAGNITATTGTSLLNGMNWGAGWTYFDATDGDSATFMGIKFSVEATPSSSGSWSLKGIDTNSTAALNLPTTLDLAVGIKAGNEFALWAFDNVAINTNNAGTFNIAFTNRGGVYPDLSHLIVFGRESHSGSGGGIPSPVPEAKTYAMILAGLGLVGFAARRRLS